MNNLYFEDFMEGAQSVLEKKADVFSIPSNSSIFPTATSQSKWKFSKGDNFIRLHDGQKVYSFNLPTGLSTEEDFELHQQPDHDPAKFEEGATSKGLAQVHRSDPGSVYFTLQEGTSNPTYTFKHVQENKWKGTPKKRKQKEEVIQNVDIPAIQQGVKEAFDNYFKKKVKTATVGDWMAHNLGHAANGVQRIAQLPGELAYRIGGENHPLLGALGLGGLVGLGALGVDQAKRKWYNTPEENADEDMEGSSRYLKYIGAPAAIAGAAGLGLNSLFKDRYRDLVNGSGLASRISDTM